MFFDVLTLILVIWLHKKKKLTVSINLKLQIDHQSHLLTSLMFHQHVPTVYNKLICVVNYIKYVSHFVHGIKKVYCCK